MLSRFLSPLELETKVIRRHERFYNYGESHVDTITITVSRHKIGTPKQFSLGKALVGAFNQEKALVGAFSVIVKSSGTFG